VAHGHTAFNKEHKKLGNVARATHENYQKLTDTALLFVFYEGA
jgi:hypothetical protein